MGQDRVVASSAVSKKRGRIVGRVVYRVGDGPEQTIPIGPCEIDLTSMDATISWIEEDAPAVAAIPIDPYITHLTDGTITVEQ